MIEGAHVTVFGPDAEAARAFLRDVLELDGVDAGGGWLIFALPPAELAVHPADGPPRHELFLVCDDIASTVPALEARGVRFTEPITDAGWGRVTRFEWPGAGELGLYEPRHPRPG
jgi:catechol 2,3-dioxygenase-like lactoylglutathione lyase family enzyme